MKSELEHQDIEAIAQRVVELLMPMLAKNNDRKEDVVFDVQGLCEYLKVSERWVYDRTKLKEIPHLKVKGLLRFRKHEIDKWLSSNNVPAVSLPDRILKAIK